MSKKEFTPEEVSILRMNEYVKSVSQRQVSFTVAFKQRFWEEYQTGKMVHSIIAEMGIDPQILGDKRIYGITRLIVETVKRGESFRDGREKLPKPEDAEEVRNPFLYMQHRINYLEQEVEFIKKIIIADREAEQRCSSKKSRK